MGREIRRVPPNWQHPKEKKYNYLSAQTEEVFKPLFDRDVETAFGEWMGEYNEWLTGGFDKVRKEHPDLKYKGDEPYRAYCDWNGQPPDPEYHRPKWSDEEATWFQMYETVSEGTPVSPPFATKEELVEYLVANGDHWDQNRRQRGVTDINCRPWSREAAQAFVNRGSVLSGMITPKGVFGPSDEEMYE